MKLEFPPIYALNECWNGNTIQQLIQPGYSSEGSVEEYTQHRVKGWVFTPHEDTERRTLIIINAAQAPEAFERALRVRRDSLEEASSVATGTWIRHPKLSDVPNAPINDSRRVDDVLDSWCSAFAYLEENPATQREGLRPPQVGAVHAVHAHWAIADQSATIVMPTGTGKTETMLSVLVSKPCGRLLVIVPTDALRSQIADKFLTLGILKQLRVVSQEALYPIVGILKHKLKTPGDVDSFFGKCNVIVTTMRIPSQCSTDVQERMAHHCPFLFIDEAHHTPARTWKAFKQSFQSQRILQFTATPFRNDGKPVDGKIIFNYPLRKAQQDGYFKRINFKPVREFDPSRADKAIAVQAIEQLRRDSERYNHILMARVASVQRAKEVYALYEPYTEFQPVQIHTGIQSVKERERIRRKIIQGESKVVVCVDMLGEGFDLPELKIAAFHDIRKSLPITLQLAGRFTRSRPDLGDATFIANIADVQVQEELRKLYSQDADWNVLLRQGSEEAIQNEVDLWEFVEGFTRFPEDISLQNLRPAMSTAIYRTRCQMWTPEHFQQGMEGIESLERIHHDINPQKSTLVIVTARKVPIDWAQTKEIFNWDWELYILFWDKQQQLLFINSSSNRGYYKKLAEAVAGKVELVTGPPVFRCFSDVNRLKLQNVGLIEQLGRLIRFTMRAGSDIEPGLTEAQRRNVIKSNIFGSGFANGKRASVGCSYKGRIWSRRTANIEALTRWCRSVGRKVLDETIDPDEVLRGTLLPVPVSECPQKMPIGIEWPEILYKEPETIYSFVINGRTVPLYHADIRLVGPTEANELKFEIRSDADSVELVLSLFEQNGIKDYRFAVVGGAEAQIRCGARQFTLADFFYRQPPVIWFVDGSSLAGNSFTELKKQYDPYPREKIQVWDWTGVNIRKESQGIAKVADSIQHRVIQQLKGGKYDVIFDDDDPGESADVVGIRCDEETIVVELYHCKFSQEDTPGARIGDLYEVCGQAQRSVYWMDEPPGLFAHLLRREPRIREEQEVSRFEQGGSEALYRIQEMSRVLPVQLRVFIVQPGLSKAKATTRQLELLSVTENYLMETYKLPFGIIAS